MRRLTRVLFPFLLLSALLVTTSSCRFFKKKKKEEPKEKPAVTEVEASPSPLPRPKPSPSPKPSRTPPMQPMGTPNPFQRIPTATPMAGMPPFPTGTPGPNEQIPHAESLATESQPLIDIKLGNPIKTAEGTTLAMDQAQVNYAGKAKLKFLWEVTSGPPDAIKVIDPQALNTHILIDNLETPAQFNLRLTASDGKTEATSELMISAFPAKLEKIRRTGGAWTSVIHMGDKWVASRGNDLEIFGPDLNPVAQVKVDRTITQFFGDESAPGKGAIYIQSPEGTWTLLQADPTTGVKKTEIPSVGRTIRRVVPFVLDGAPYLFALLERSVELWNLSDPGHPRLKTTLGSFLKDPLYLAFAGRNIYVADEESIHLIDFSTGNLVASIPSGGSISSLATYSVDNKNFLLSSIDKDRTPQGRKDYGLRVFEIGADGRLGNEQRLQLKDNVPIKKAIVIPGAAKALLSVAGAQGPELRMMDFKQMKEIPLEFPKGFHFFALNGIETGKIQGNPVAVVADGNQLRTLAFKQQGEPASKFTVELKTSLPGMISAAWVQADPEGKYVWAGDEGSLGGGSLTLVDGQELNFLKNWEASAGHFPAEADLGNTGEEGPVLYLGEDPSALPAGEKEGELGLMEKKDPPNANQELSKPFLGENSKQGMLRPLGVKARAM